MEVFKLFNKEGGFENEDSENVLLYISYQGELWDTAGVLFIGEERSVSLDQSVEACSRSSKSGVEGGRVSSICTSVVVSRMLIILESESCHFSIYLQCFY